MKPQTVNGIGCYAKPERLSRIFKKLVQDYTLGPFNGSQVLDGSASAEIKGVDMLQALRAGQISHIRSGGRESPSFKAFSKITGFYLTLNDQGLILSIFARSNGCRPEIITTRLDGLTKLRQKRLH
jgi:hypothetical protein